MLDTLVSPRSLLPLAVHSPSHIPPAHALWWAHLIPTNKHQALTNKETSFRAHKHHHTSQLLTPLFKDTLHLEAT